jgi:ATP-dependent DNA helicase RecG
VAEKDGKLLIVLWCPGGSTRPYSSPRTMGAKSERVQWIRHMASTVAPSAEETRELYELSNNVPFDDRVNYEASLSDLNITLIENYLRQVNSSLADRVGSMEFGELCRAMRIADGPDEFLKPLNVGLLFFSLDPQKFFPCTQIDIVEFPEGEGGSRIVEHSFRGPIHNQMREALQYLRNSVMEECVVKRDEVAEATRFFNYPYAAIEEAVANAVYHKGYDSREPIEIRVLSDRIEILSHPGADRSITIEGLKNFSMTCRRYRNRRVGEFLKELHLTEGRNTGVHKMLRALHDNGSPAPVFETDEDRLYFMTTIYARDFETGPAASDASGRRPRDEALLKFFAEEPDASISQAAGYLSCSVATVKRDLARLQEAGRIKRVGSARGGVWRVI